MMNKKEKRLKRKLRIRAKVNGTKERPRLSVYRSNTTLYVQIVDDAAQITLHSIVKKGTTVVAAKEIGTSIAAMLKKMKITSAVYDRGGYQYHGVIKAIAESVREGGIQI